ncbi:MAG: hypothetical protein IID31_11015 [Planctomycetes bacterium]|nr:hypothetical protein [Planctomycetota bacterium]
MRLWVGVHRPTLASTIRDHLHLHVGFCQWTRDDGVMLWVCAARDNDGQRWVAKHGADPVHAQYRPELLAVQSRVGER